nr:DUF3152 domain-containing protein [Nocardioides agariphilus]
MLRWMFSAMVLAVLLVPVPAEAREPLVSLTPPSVSGDPVYGEAVQVDPGTWSAEPVGYTYQWLRAGVAIDGATSQSYVPTLADIDHPLSVQVTATDAASDTGTATTAETAPTRRAELRLLHGVRISGVLRWGHTLKVSRGTWNEEPTRYRYQWYRGQVAIPGATSQTYRTAVADVGRRLKARVYVKKRGYELAWATDVADHRIGYRVPVRRTVTYRIETRGHITASVATFARLAAQTYADPRGWRNAGVAFKRVKGPSDFSLVLAEASTLPGFSSVCSVEWSCRAGRYVVINQTRWLHASTSWNAASKSLRDYRNMVVNHETGHWLGHGHLGCPGPGKLAPVMMQQSKGLDGCRHNPWPLGSELWFR